MKYIKENKKSIILIIIIAIVTIVSMFAIIKLNTDGMNNYGVYNIKYKIFQNGKWSKFSKNGITVGDKENPIQNISISAKQRKGRIYYYTYTNDWSDQIFETPKDNSNQISGLKFNLSDTLYKKYSICYRTYNKKDKWLNWTCDGEISGNKEEPITALEIKIIPKGSLKFDYLKDFNKTINASNNF